MSDNKRYYYLKLKDNFFDSDELMVLESLPDGYMYSNILLKLYLRGLKNDGKLMVNERIPYNSTMLATVTRHPVAVVEKAIKIFIDLGLIEVMENGAIYLLDIQNYIGESSTEADRKRRYREKIESEKLLPLPTNGTNVPRNVPKCPDENPPETEIEKELDLDLDLELELEKEKELELKKKIKKEKSPSPEKKTSFAEFVTLTQTEYDMLTAKLGNEQAVKDCIDILDNYKGSSGKKYKSDYRAILSWVIDKYKAKKKESSTTLSKSTQAAEEAIRMLKERGL
ncbi:MAG: phage replisome organizer N-terminal domain-containing protein [Chlamydiales bacterium]|nr:phage replisome organizer N-terminal domain-containing protein [Chlamydiales bacterium]